MEGLTRVPVREQEPEVRAANFEEVCLGYNEEEAVAEAKRCLNCKNAQCMKGCPVAIHIPEFINEVKATSKKLIILSVNHLHFLLYVAVYAHRRVSVKENVSVVSRVSRLQSVN